MHHYATDDHDRESAGPADCMREMMIQSLEGLIFSSGCRSLKEAMEFFGPVQWYLTEDGIPMIARKFFLIDNALRDDRMAIAQPHKNVEEASWKYGPNR